MRNEYLFLSDENRQAVQDYKPEKISVMIVDIENTKLWTVSYISDTNNKKGAGRLSDVDKELKKYSPLVLSCESSAYYNKALYPLVNTLERKLRKLLYLAVSISGDADAKKNIKELETKDFGQIFDLLFIDQKFIKDLKMRVNADAKGNFNGRDKFSKNEIMDYLLSLEENTLWDTILGPEDVPTLRKRFRDVQTYRNDVMHAHNIDKETYGKARYLFNQVNKELDNAITNLVGGSEDDARLDTGNVNSVLTVALDSMRISELVNATMKDQIARQLSALSLSAEQALPLETINVHLSDIVRKSVLTRASDMLMENIRTAIISQASSLYDSTNQLQKHIDLPQILKMLTEEIIINETEQRNDESAEANLHENEEVTELPEPELIH